MWVLLLKYGIATTGISRLGVYLMIWHVRCQWDSCGDNQNGKRREQKEKKLPISEACFQMFSPVDDILPLVFRFSPFFFLQQQLPRLMMSVTWVFSANRSKNVAPKRELDFFTETSFPLSLPSTLGFERTLWAIPVYVYYTTPTVNICLFALAL